MFLKTYEASDRESWDNFCYESYQGTFLHTRKFLSYHEDRFRDTSLIIFHNNQIVGLLPAAEDPNDDKMIISHPGISYGGLLSNEKLRGELQIEAISEIKKYYYNRGYKSFIYKVVPNIYHQVPAADDLYSLFRSGAKLIRRDLSSAININFRINPSSRRLRCQKKAIKFGVKIEDGTSYLPEFWEVLTDNLRKKFDTFPVHSLDEILLLHSYFPENILCTVAKLGEELVAGVVMFVTKTCIHAQYIAANDKGMQTSALDLIFEHCIEKTKLMNKNWFDFGISNENSGQFLNEGLYQFKSEFGGGGVAHDFYLMNLEK